MATRTIHSLLILFFLGISLEAWSFLIHPVRQSGRGSQRSELFAERRFAQAPKKRLFGADSQLGSKHMERIKLAGRKGTKRFVDPCKVFIGNLPFDVKVGEMTDFILSTMGQSKLVLHQSKVIEDWKTGKSKGYGFVVFTDPIFATVCMDVCNGKELKGRQIKVAQGKKKDEDSQLYLKKREKPQTDEDAAIARALDEAESDEDDDEIPTFGGQDDEDLELDAALFGIAGDEDDDDYDGTFLERAPVYEGEIDPDLNREQRREAARRLKRQKLPHKGFG